MRGPAAAAAAVLALAGCGDALAGFRDDLRPLEQRAAEQRAQIAATLRGATLGSRADARALRTQSVALESTFREIAQLDPPEGYEAPFADYVHANARMVRGLERFASALVARNTRGLRRVSTRVMHGLGESQRARLHWLE